MRKSEYARLSGADRRYIKGQKYIAARRIGKVLTSRRAGKRSARLLAANKFSC